MLLLVQTWGKRITKTTKLMQLKQQSRNVSIVEYEENEDYWSLMFLNGLRSISNYLWEFLEDKWGFQILDKGKYSSHIQQVGKSRKLQASQQNSNSWKNCETNHQTIHLQGRAGSNSPAMWRQPAFSLTEQNVRHRQQMFYTFTFIRLYLQFHIRF